MKAPKDMTLEELQETLRTWRPFCRPAYGWLSASEDYYRRRKLYQDELSRRYKANDNYEEE